MTAKKKDARELIGKLFRVVSYVTTDPTVSIDAVTDGAYNVAGDTIEVIVDERALADHKLPRF